MKWWVRARLRTKIFIAFSSLIIAVLLATLGFTQIVVSREVERTLDRDLMTTGEVFEVLFNERGARLQTNSILLASDFALKSAVATHFDLSTYEPETLASAAQSWQERIGVDLFWITDELGDSARGVVGEGSRRGRNRGALAAARGDRVGGTCRRHLRSGWNVVPAGRRAGVRA